MSVLDSGGISEEIFTSTPRVTVKFNIGEDKTLTLPFEMETSARQLRKELSNLLKVPPHDLSISHNSKFINDSQTLADFSVTSCGSIVMNLKTNHSIDFSLLFTQIYGDIPIKDVINVTVSMGKYKKKYERDSQTSPRKVSRAEGTPHVAATQTPISGIYIIDPLNKQVTPGRYTSTADFEEKVFLFENKLRNWLSKARKNLYRNKIQEYEVANENINFCDRRSRPIEKTGKDDHSIKKETEKSYTGKIKLYSNNYLLMKEIKHLMMVEMEKRDAREKYEKTRNINMVKKFSEPYEWIGKDGRKLLMETEHHREFLKWQEIYSKLVNKDIPFIERKLLIVSLKEMVEDIYYIVNTIWHGESILSENKDLVKLRLCRFDNAIQWSPWNCLLVTYKEMLTHNLVDDPLE
ncbi:hypothetical protein J437_LFUL018444, partial [Ladona fulva]